MPPLTNLGLPIGKQDQYASAFGGLNVIKFASEGVSVTPLAIPPDVERQLERNLVLFFTGRSRQSSTILRRQRQSTEEKSAVVIDSLHAIKGLAVKIIEALLAGELDRFGDLLDQSWQRKKLLEESITNTFIDECYALARASGALGGKITGAGGRGFWMLFCPEQHQAALTKILEDRGLLKMDFRFDRQGTQVLINDEGHIGEMS